MSSHIASLNGDDLDDARAVDCLGRVLSRCFDALSDMRVTSMVRRARAYTGSFGHSPEFSELDRMAPGYGIVWRLDDDGTFTIDF